MHPPPAYAYRLGAKQCVPTELLEESKEGRMVTFGGASSPEEDRRTYISVLHVRVLFLQIVDTETWLHEALLPLDLGSRSKILAV